MALVSPALPILGRPAASCHLPRRFSCTPHLAASCHLRSTSTSLLLHSASRHLLPPAALLLLRSASCRRLPPAALLLLHSAFYLLVGFGATACRGLRTNCCLPRLLSPCRAQRTHAGPDAVAQALRRGPHHHPTARGPGEGGQVRRAHCRRRCWCLLFTEGTKRTLPFLSCPSGLQIATR